MQRAPSSTDTNRIDVVRRVRHFSSQLSFGYGAGEFSWRMSHTPIPRGSIPELPFAMFSSRRLGQSTVSMPTRLLLAVLPMTRLPAEITEIPVEFLRLPLLAFTSLMV